jgi:hypothetical protein
MAEMTATGAATKFTCISPISQCMRGCEPCPRRGGGFACRVRKTLRYTPMRRATDAARATSAGWRPLAHLDLFRPAMPRSGCSPALPVSASPARADYHATLRCPGYKGDISTLPGRGHFYFALTLVVSMFAIYV